MIRINNIKASLEMSHDDVINMVVNNLEIKPEQLKSIKIAKKSVDARSKRDVHFVYSFDIELSYGEDKIDGAETFLQPQWKPLENVKLKKRPVVIGSGPSGMMAALALAEAGLNPIIIERGCEVQQRQNDVNKFWKDGKLKLESNVQFGEGGAGTFSDGKLMTGIKKDENMSKVLSEFIEAGAPEEILYLAKPHIGTDNLSVMVQNIRKKILALGGEYRFETKLVGLKKQGNQLVGIELQNANNIYELETNHVVLAIGHSARDTFEMLYNSGVEIQAKSFAVGVRIEHQQSLINQVQYGDFAHHIALGSADYKLAVHLPNARSLYSFCMCPGGSVVAATSEEGRVVTNGMSEFARDNVNANSALLVGVNPSDFGGNHPLQGMYWQRDLEVAAYKLGGSNYNAPIQMVGDFLKNQASTRIGKVKPSYTPNVKLTNLSLCLPEFVTETLRMGLVEMDKKLRGFASSDAIMTAVESRSSSPIRIFRDENMQSNIKGLYPCGEGAGYAGGISSSAVDGLRVTACIMDI